MTVYWTIDDFERQDDSLLDIEGQLITKRVRFIEDGVRSWEMPIKVDGEQVFIYEYKDTREWWIGSKWAEELPTIGPFGTLDEALINLRLIQDS